MSGKSKGTILITGINGFLGSHLAKSLCKNYEVIGLEYDLLNLFRIEKYNFKVYSSNESLEDIFEKYRFFSVIHAATVYRKDKESVQSLFNTNLLLPIKLYELANQFNVKLFLNTDSFFNNPNSKYSYLQDYTLSKKHVLEWLRLLCENNKKCRLMNLKLFHMYGQGDSPNKFITQIIYKVKNDSKIDLTLGEQTRDFIFIDDVVSAYEIVLKNGAGTNEFYNEYEVGTGIETTVKELVLMLKNMSENENVALNFGALPYRDNEIMRSKANNSPLVEMGWIPKYDIRKGFGKIF